MSMIEGAYNHAMEPESVELYNYAVNTGILHRYRNEMLDAVRHGTEHLADYLAREIVTKAARMYERENGTRGSRIFTARHRLEAALILLIEDMKRADENKAAGYGYTV